MRPPSALGVRWVVVCGKALLNGYGVAPFFRCHPPPHQIVDGAVSFGKNSATLNLSVNRRADVRHATIGNGLGVRAWAVPVRVHRLGRRAGSRADGGAFTKWRRGGATAAEAPIAIPGLPFQKTQELLRSRPRLL